MERKSQYQRDFEELKILYTWWTQPHIDKNVIEQALTLFCLSILSFKQFYKEIHVVTDNVGYKLLSQLDLGITIHNRLNNVGWSKTLWAAPKYYTYHKFLGERFLHVDMDIIISRPFNNPMKEY